MVVNRLRNIVYRLLKRRVARYTALFFISISILAIIASSFQCMASYQAHLFAITYLSSFVFLLEYIARIFTAPLACPYKRPYRAKLTYIFSFYGFVDFVATLPWILTYLFWDTEVVHVVILPYILIIFKLIRHLKSLNIIGKAILSVKEELIISYTACLIVVSFSAILMYYLERGAQPDVYRNVGDGFWWSIVTFTTTGYGDIYPITPLGKFLGSIISMVGIAMIAIPTGIISSAFIGTVQQRNLQREKERKQQEQGRSNGRINDD